MLRRRGSSAGRRTAHRSYGTSFASGQAHLPRGRGGVGPPAAQPRAGLEGAVGFDLFADAPLVEVLGAAGELVLVA